MESIFNNEKVANYIEKQFENSVLPTLKDFIRIPNLSKGFDDEWKTNGLMEKAANLLVDWVKDQKIDNIQIDLLNHKENDRTPMIFIDIQPTNKNQNGTILFYGHLDKQPHFTGWNEGLGPVTPVVIDDKLYGRGSVDDGYAIFASILSIKACQHFKLEHPRCVIMIEADEESEGIDLPYYFDVLSERIRIPDIIVCLDSGCLDYKRLWVTTSLRGILTAKIKIKILKEGVHSGDGSGIIPSSFRILRQILDRIDNSKTGEVNSRFQVVIPPEFYKSAHDIAEIMGEEILSYPFYKNMKPTTSNITQALINKNWKPQLSCTGIDGLPETAIAGNVLRPETIQAISLRLPPSLNSEKACKDLKELVENNPPYNAEIELIDCNPGDGWFVKETSKFVKDSVDTVLNNASKIFFNKETVFFGEGGSIPFMNFLSEKYPKAHFVVLGCCGPNSNAHGPNESLDMPFVKKLICCITMLVNNSTNILNKIKN